MPHSVLHPRSDLTPLTSHSYYIRLLLIYLINLCLRYPPWKFMMALRSRICFIRWWTQVGYFPAGLDVFLVLSLKLVQQICNPHCLYLKLQVILIELYQPFVFMLVFFVAFGIILSVMWKKAGCLFILFAAVQSQKCSLLLPRLTGGSFTEMTECSTLQWQSGSGWYTKLNNLRWNSHLMVKSQVFWFILSHFCMRSVSFFLTEEGLTLRN